METLTKRKKKVKKKVTEIEKIKWQRMPLENWEELNYEKILEMTPEALRKIKEEKHRFIRVYFDHIKRIEWCGFLLNIAKKDNERILIIQQLGIIRKDQKKIVKVAVTEKISIELSTD